MTRFRWVIMGLIFLGTTFNYIERLAMGLLASDLQRIYSISDLEYGYIGFAFGMAYAVGQLLSGAMLDKLGTRLGYAVSLAGWAVAGMLTALGRGVVSFSIFRALLGFTQSPAYPAGAKVSAEWFPRRQRAIAFSFVNVGASVAAIVAPSSPIWSGSLMRTPIRGPS